MSQQFNPYHVWLGIPLEQQPANYYRLLGIEMFEDDPDVITSAADKQMAHLRTFQAGKHGTLTQRLLNEVSAARICLLDPEQKAEYDSALHSQPATGFSAVVSKTPSKSSVHKPERKNFGQILSVVGMVVVALVVAVAYLVLGRTTQQVAYETKPAIKSIDAPKVVESPKPSKIIEAPKPEPKPEPPKPELKSELSKPEPKPEPVKPEPPKPELKPEPQDERKVPGDEQLKQAKKQVVETFRDDIFSAKDPTSLRELAKKLMEQTADSRSDRAVQYALLDLARQAALKAKDWTTAFDAIDKMAEAFDINRNAMKGEILTNVAKNMKTPVGYQIIAEKALEVAAEAIKDNDFDTATNMAKLALSEAGKYRSKDLSQQARNCLRDAEQAKKAFADVEEATETLKSKPNDPKANTLVGKYACFVKGDWEHGLPMLAKGDDEKLSELAQQDLKEPTKCDGQVMLADSWYDLPGSSATKKRIQLRAAHWYWLAASEAAGLTKTKVERRMKSLTSLVNTISFPRRIMNKKDGSVLVLIPAGKFLAGERKFPVDLPAFYLGMYVVTDAQYKKFTSAAQHTPQSGSDDKSGLGYPAFVSWNEAQAYCKWAGLRLPTELEWEKGASGTDGRTFPWGNEWDTTKCKYHDGKTSPAPCPVDAYPEGRSPYGLYNMSGNACQWCQDFFHADAFDRYAVGDFSPATRATKPPLRVCKGGMFALGADRRFSVYACAGRDPTFHMGGQDEYRQGTGFRVAKNVMP